VKYVKPIVCFAHSRKTGGYCIAGKEWKNGAPGGWIRPVSSRPTHEIYLNEQRCEDGSNVSLLDIVYVPLNHPSPILHQSENHVIDPSVSWEREGRLSWSKINDWLDNPESLWELGNGSFAGLNNRIEIGRGNGTSLYLITVPKIRLLVGAKAPEYPDSKRAVRGEFSYGAANYRMDITDPFIEHHYLGRPDGRYEIGEPVLCVSLGDDYQGHYYKLVAGILYEGRFL